MSSIDMPVRGAVHPPLVGTLAFRGRRPISRMLSGSCRGPGSVTFLISVRSTVGGLPGPAAATVQLQLCSCQWYRVVCTIVPRQGGDRGLAGNKKTVGCSAAREPIQEIPGTDARTASSSAGRLALCTCVHRSQTAA